MRAPILVNIFRHETVESSHLVDAVVTDHIGKVIETYGDVDKPFYARSMIKPIQAIPFVESGAAEDAPDTMKAIALSCASHASEHLHIDFLKQWHAKLGIETESALACGPQKPDDDTVYFEIIRAQEHVKRINNNCSGKHTGMIATAIKKNISYKGYEQFDHAIQKEVRKVLSKYSQTDLEKAAWGIDGCGIPTYAIPQTAIAKMLSAMHSDELKQIRQACAAYPYMTGGHEWPDSEINAATKGRIFAKVGAEGNYAAVLYNEGKTIVVKSRDGAFRAAEAALTELLEKHGQLKSEEREKIRAHANPPIKNWAGTLVGSVRASLIH